jgi:hypothetical protein
MQARLEKIEDIIRTCYEKSPDFIEGNCVYSHLSLNVDPDLIPKQNNLKRVGELYSKERICEIGFNAGHSCLMLLDKVKKGVEYIIFDICEHSYTRPCIEYVKSQFPQISFQLNAGDSRAVLPIWSNVNSHLLKTFDIVHVDGGHDTSCLCVDIGFALLLAKKDGIVIVDDTDQAPINNIVDVYVCNGMFVDITNEFEKTIKLHHRILRKV